MAEHFKPIYDFMYLSNEFDSPLQLMLYAIIYSYKGHKCYAAADTLADMCKVNVKSIYRGLEKLEEKGLIEISKKGNSKHSKSLYSVLRIPVVNITEIEDIFEDYDDIVF